VDAAQAIVSRIFFCGDPHGHLEHIHSAVREHRPAAIVLLGDVQTQEPLEQALKPILDLTEVWWIPGNHDTDSDA
jgi:metallophosphoesterase superfamily enzyme